MALIFLCQDMQEEVLTLSLICLGLISCGLCLFQCILRGFKIIIRLNTIILCQTDQIPHFIGEFFIIGCDTPLSLAGGDVMLLLMTEVRYQIGLSS